MTKSCLEKPAGGGSRQILPDQRIQGKPGKGFLCQEDPAAGVLLQRTQDFQILLQLLLVDHIAGGRQLTDLHLLFSISLPGPDPRIPPMEVPTGSALPYTDPDRILPH